MKQIRLTHTLIAATLILTAAGAYAAATAVNEPAPVQGPGHAALLERFDQDKDGVLDENERAAAREAMQARRRAGPPPAWRGAAAPQHGPQPAHADKRMGEQAFRRGFLLGKFDQNNDGKLDDTEKAAARAAGEQRLRTQMEKQLQRLKAVDADGDGKISDPEWAAAREKFQQERKEKGQDRPRPFMRRGALMGPGPGANGETPEDDDI